MPIDPHVRTIATSCSIGKNVRLFLLSLQTDFGIAHRSALDPRPGGRVLQRTSAAILLPSSIATSRFGEDQNHVLTFIEKRPLDHIDRNSAES